MQTAEANGGMTKPGAYGDKPLPRRTGPKGLLPSTWLQRSVRLEYIGAGEKLQSTTGVLVDTFPFGPALLISGEKTLLSWERLILVALVDD